MFSNPKVTFTHQPSPPSHPFSAYLIISHFTLTLFSALIFLPSLYSLLCFDFSPLPYGFGSFGFSSDLSSPVESVVGSTNDQSRGLSGPPRNPPQFLFHQKIPSLTLVSTNSSSPLLTRSCRHVK